MKTLYAMTLLLTTLAGTATAQVLSDPTRPAFRNRFGDLCIDIPGSSTARETAIQGYACNGTKAQKFVHTQNLELRVYDGTSNVMCLDNYAYQTAPGSKVVIWNCNGQDNQKWYVAKNGTIYSPTSKQCLTLNVKDATAFRNTPNGTAINLQPCKGLPQQRWARTRM